MDCLVNLPNDANLLRRCGIINNFLGDDVAVCTMLNKLGIGGVIVSDNFCYAQLFNNVNEHCRKRYNRWMANLRHKYFNSPWALISFGAAVALLLLTAVQTI
ncbi:unnamed protein product, partial [Ilex paraguariensis]